MSEFKFLETAKPYSCILLKKFFFPILFVISTVLYEISKFNNLAKSLFSNKFFNS